MRPIYDTGVLIAADRDDRKLWLQHRSLLEKGRLEEGRRPYVTAPVIAQASRSPRRALLHRPLDDCDVVPFGEPDTHAVGRLLAEAGTADVVDAHVARTAIRNSCYVITSDAADFERLSGQLPRPLVIGRV